MGWWDDTFGGAQEAKAAALKKEQTGIYDQKAQDALKTGYATGTESINKGIDAFAPLGTLAGKYNAGGDLYLDSLGINGPGGNDRATSAFRNEPGYGGAVDAGLDAIKRMRASMGMGDSGNANLDALKFGQNLQDQQYTRWQGQLADTGKTGIGLATNLAQGQAGGYTNLANLAHGYASDQTGVAGNVMAGINSANDQEAAGKAAGAKNLLGAGLSLAALAAAPFTGGASLAGLGAALKTGASNATGAVMGQQWQQNNPGVFGSSFYGPVAPGQ